ncbi:hypothetical protein SJI45_20950 [Streptomyces sp. S399]|uniref:hypothetical protein n=1 Tax=Streptomyces sp. S399 TaxID=3096009 RepID=UPI002A80BBB1|nr:hypothetical protein [Streptomyces sp. S399]WPR53153.1 hypothetical protein SJI45_20950 [Streptomyces sp. S399]
MIVETVGALAIGLGVAWLALRRLPHRLPDPRLVGPTGAETAAASKAAAIKGMEEMSARFKAEGAEIYLPAAE